MPLSRKSEEEKEEARAAKEAKKADEARERAEAAAFWESQAGQTYEARAREAKEVVQARHRDEAARKRAEADFWASPAGKARAAFQAGDRLFQVSFNALQTETYVIPLSRAGTIQRSSDPTTILNSICDEGWEIVNGSFVFLELGSESRDKFMRSGQDVAVHGTVIGYYLFHRNEKMLDARSSGAAPAGADVQSSASSLTARVPVVVLENGAARGRATLHDDNRQKVCAMTGRGHRTSLIRRRDRGFSIPWPPPMRPPA